MKTTHQAAPRMDELNAAYQRRSTAIAEYQASMRRLRESATRDGYAALRANLMVWTENMFEAAYERDPVRCAGLEQTARHAKEAADSLSQARELLSDVQDELRERLKAKLALIDEELLSLGGNLSARYK